MILVLLLALCIPSFAQTLLTKERIAAAFKKLDFQMPVRVLLDEKPSQSAAWKLKSAEGFVIFVPDKKITTVFKAHELMVTYQNNSVVLNGKVQAREHLFILPLSGYIGHNTLVFDGVIAITKQDSTLFLVNHVDLEDYVFSVLPYESVLGWPDEVQKAFCVAMRTYGICKVLEQRAIFEKNKQVMPYDIKNTTAHQVYKGRIKDSPFKKIIEDTRSVVLAHNNKPIIAMFDICCGGIIPARTTGIHFSKAPYLARKFPCYFCKEYKLYRWNQSYSFSHVESAMKKDFPGWGALTDIKIKAADAAGQVKELKLRCGHNWHTISGAKFKAWCKTIPSLCFTLSRSGKKVTLSGKGHGHLIGLCQRGAYAMALKGWGFKNILKYYYPGVQFMKLKKEG